MTSCIHCSSNFLCLFLPDQHLYIVRNMYIYTNLIAQACVWITTGTKNSVSETFLHKSGAEICALKLSYCDQKIYVITLYRSPSGDFDFFLLHFDSVLHLLYNSTQHIICGDINIDYLVGSERKKQQDNLLLTYNITSIITFPVRLQNTSATSIDNMFLYTTWLEEHTVLPISNGLSYHDAQLLTIRTKVSNRPVRSLKTVRNFNNYTISDFINKLSNESRDMVFNS